MNIEEIKELILWLKKEKVKSFSTDKFSLEFSDLALIENLEEPKADELYLDSRKTWAESSEIPKDDPDLFHSVGG